MQKSLDDYVIKIVSDQGLNIDDLTDFELEILRYEVQETIKKIKNHRRYVSKHSQPQKNRSNEIYRR